MVKKIAILLTIVSIASLQTMYSAYTVDKTQTTPIVVSKDGYPVQRPGINVVPAKRVTAVETTPTAPIKIASVNHKTIKRAVNALNKALGSNQFRINCFDGTQHGPVGPHDVVIKQWPNPNYKKGLMGAGRYCYLVFTPEKSILEGVARADEEGHLPVISTEESASME